MRQPARTAAIILSFLAAFFTGFSAASAQSLVQDRIPQSISDSAVIALPGTANPLARSEYDTGRINPSTPYTGMTMYFRPSAEQQAALDALVQAQQTPGSSLYHQWITPAQYAGEFGVSSNDLAKAQAWLEQKGFAVERISNSRNAIVFSGTAAQVESAFHTELHHYTIQGVAHTSNAGPLSLPSALAGVVMSVRGLSDFRPHPLHRFAKSNAVKGQYTFSSGGTTYHFLAPGDFATIYDLAPLYNAGYTGSGKTIVIVGQTAIATTDITHFQTAAGLATKTPTLTLVPNSGTSVADDTSGDEDESDLDIEWSGAVATGATIDFVYTGNNQNYGVFDSIQYAIDNDLGPIISSSYGACEASVGASDAATFETWFEQANTQGQTIVSAAGDDGATDCETTAGSGTKGTIVNGDEATQGLAVDFPGSSPYVTSIGGTEFLGDVSSPGTYWNSTNSSTETSALQYIPEMVWNDTSTTNGIDAGGGGASTLFGKPSWQTGVGVPIDGHRDVPDISLNASPQHDGYLFCATGTGNADSDPTSCSNGFLDSSGDPTVAGGTSFGAPTFSGILAILSQKLNVNGLGNVNPEIYSLAASDYASAFHDTTSGNNEIPCEVGSTDCTTSPIGYAATTGYDLASGWGSIDASNFAGAFTTTVTAPATASYTLSATNVTVAQGSSGASTVTVTPNGFTGTVALVATAPTNLTNTCFAYADPTATTTGTITVYTSESACVAAGLRRPTAASLDQGDSGSTRSSLALVRAIAGTTLVSLVFIGFPGRRRRNWPMLCAILMLGSLTLAVTGCGSSGSTTTTTTTAAKGTYTITVTGTNAAQSLSATTTFTLTVD